MAFRDLKLVTDEFFTFTEYPSQEPQVLIEKEGLPYPLYRTFPRPQSLLASSCAINKSVGVKIPSWLLPRREVTERAKFLYAYLLERSLANNFVAVEGPNWFDGVWPWFRLDSTLKKEINAVTGIKPAGTGPLMLALFTHALVGNQSSRDIEGPRWLGDQIYCVWPTHAWATATHLKAVP